jgi:nicotinate-nucleotide adenylyltransferase
MNDNEKEISISKIKKYIKNNLSRDRYLHSLGVASEAVRLAINFNSDIYKAYISGLLHDCAKENQNKIYLCKLYNIKLDEYFLKQIELTHSFLAAEIARNIFFINDEDILNSIKYHTTARPMMSLLEKIVYVADKIEPNRSFDDVENLRKVSYKNLDLAIISNLKFVINKNKLNGCFTHPLSIEALKYYESLVM